MLYDHSRLGSWKRGRSVWLYLTEVGRGDYPKETLGGHSWNSWFGGRVLAFLLATVALIARARDISSGGCRKTFFALSLVVPIF